MPKNHLKRIAAPHSWKIKRKKHIWVIRAKGPHKLENSIPLAVLLRDILKHAKTMKEVKDIINNKVILVNGKRRKDPHFGIGIMDIVEIPEVKEKYIILIDKLGKIIALKTNLNSRISKIINKKRIGKRTQLNLFGGENFIVEKDNYKTGDSVIIDNKKIKEHLKFEEGANCFLTGGSHKGEFGNVSKIEKDSVFVKIDNSEFETKKDFIYIIGKEKIVVEK
ncbi:MAG: 30S ribosomal protein S4e [Candidatus Woesearchaeota archaeon]